MKSRNLLLGGAVFLALLIYVFFTQTGNKGFNTITLPSLPKIAAGDMTRIEIGEPAGRMVLEQTDGHWKIVEPFAFPADKNKLESLQRLLAELRLTDLISENPKSPGEYGLVSGTALTLEVTGKPGTKLSLTVGSSNSTGTHTFVQLPKGSGVYQVLGDIVYQLKRPASEWRSLQIYDFLPESAQRVEISRPDSKRPLVLVRSEEAEPKIVTSAPQGVTSTPLPVKVVWKAGKQQFPEARLAQWVNVFAHLSAAKIADNVSWTGKPLAVLKVKTAEAEYSLEVLQFLKAEKQVRVRRAGEAVMFDLPESQIQSLLKSERDLL